MMNLHLCIKTLKHYRSVSFHWNFIFYINWCTNFFLKNDKIMMFQSCRLNFQVGFQWNFTFFILIKAYHHVLQLNYFFSKIINHEHVSVDSVLTQWNLSLPKISNCTNVHTHALMCTVDWFYKLWKVVSQLFSYQLPQNLHQITAWCILQYCDFGFKFFLRLK